LLLGGSMVYNGAITPEQLTSFMFYVQVHWATAVAATFGVCSCTVFEQWIGVLLSQHVCAFRAAGDEGNSSSALVKGLSLVCPAQLLGNDVLKCCLLLCLCCSW
jgi:hypothetical protein